MRVRGSGFGVQSSGFRYTEIGVQSSALQGAKFSIARRAALAKSQVCCDEVNDDADFLRREYEEHLRLQRRHQDSDVARNAHGNRHAMSGVNLA